MTVNHNLIQCDGYACPSVERLDVPLDSVRGSDDWTFQVRCWFEEQGWRTVDAGDGKRRADLCPQHAVARQLSQGGPRTRR
jgi:hypothetical protein